MRSLFIGLLFVSLLAVGGAYYWRTYHPESVVAVEMGASRTPTARDKSGAIVAAPAEKGPSGRQDWAMMISIGSSIISAFGAVAQVWLTHRNVSRA